MIYRFWRRYNVDFKVVNIKQNRRMEYCMFPSYVI